MSLDDRVVRPPTASFDREQAQRFGRTARRVGGHRHGRRSRPTDAWLEFVVGGGRERPRKLRAPFEQRVVIFGDRGRIVIDRPFVPRWNPTEVLHPKVELGPAEDGSRTSRRASRFVRRNRSAHDFALRQENARWLRGIETSAMAFVSRLVVPLTVASVLISTSAHAEGRLRSTQRRGSSSNASRGRSTTTPSLRKRGGRSSTRSTSPVEKWRSWAIDPRGRSASDHARPMVVARGDAAQRRRRVRRRQGRLRRGRVSHVEAGASLLHAQVRLERRRNEGPHVRLEAESVRRPGHDHPRVRCAGRYVAFGRHRSRREVEPLRRRRAKAEVPTSSGWPHEAATRRSPRAPRTHGTFTLVRRPRYG